MACLVPSQVEDAVLAAVSDREEDVVAAMVTFALEYGALVRDDRRRFVDAFCSDRIPGVTSTRSR